MGIIGLTGKQGAGKSTAAAYLRKNHGYAGSNLTDPMDEMLTPLLRRMKVPEHEIAERLSGSMKNTPIPGFEWLTGRKLKQALGLEFRDAVSRPTEGGGTDSCFFQDLWYGDNEEHKNLVHEQIRYEFEARKAQDKGGIVIKIVDPDALDDDAHPSEMIDFPVDYEITNPKTGTDQLHAALDRLLGPASQNDSGETTIISKSPNEVLEAKDGSPITALDAAIDKAFNEHGDEIRDFADRLDDGDDALSEAVDDVVSEMKSSIGAAAANNVSDNEAESAIAAVERWITENISNSTSDRRIAAVFAQLGPNDARKQLS